MRHLPTGLVTFLFTDIEGSTELLGGLGIDAYGRLQDDHADILRRAIAAGDGVEIRTEGDSFFAVFANPRGAVAAAVSAQRELARHAWPDGAELKIRMGIHTGEGKAGGDDYLGIDVNRAARIASVGHGGQVLLSDATRGLVEPDLPDGVALRDLGQHRFKGLSIPLRVFQLTIEGLPTDFPALASVEARPNNLPVQLTSFVGRDDEIATTLRLIGQHRLVTLTGPGGTGKTRLALAVAAEALPTYRDGAFFVDLAPVADPDAVPSAIAQALGVKEEERSNIAEALAGHLADKELLLIPDNFEHVLEAAPVVDRILSAAPALRVLATSRTPLGLYGEQEQPVPPLTLPDPRALPDLETLTRYEAVALFTDRARSARPDFEVSNENAPAVAGICGRLDGLPLAIELAASRVKILSPEAILSRLDNRLDLLTASTRNLPERQRTLRAAMEWSYGLLDAPERRLFARLSAFAGGSDLAAIEAVTRAEDIDTLEGVSSLVEKSLVRQAEPASGEPRFSMLETVREFAAERCRVEWDAEATLHRHAEHFLALAQAAKPHLDGPDHVRWLDRLDRDHENIQSALRWTLRAGQAERGLTAASAIWRFWQQRGHLAIGRSWLERLLAGATAPSPARVDGLAAAGSLAYWQGDAAATEACYQESLALSERLGYRRGVGEALRNLAFVPILRGTDLPKAIELFERSIEVFEEIGDDQSAARSRADIAFVFGLLGDYASALPLLKQSVETARRQGDLFYLADNLSAVGQSHRFLGHHEESRRAYLESLALFEEADNPSGIAGILLMLSGLESTVGRHERSVRLYGAGSALNESIGGTAPAEALKVGDPVGAARAAIGDAATDRALAEGGAMSRDEAVAYARKSED